MMRERLKVTWAEAWMLTAELAAKITSAARPLNLFGIPSGGAPVALMLGQRLLRPVVDAPELGTLIVDDICDSGQTLAQFSPAMETAVLFARPASQGLPSYVGAVTEAWVQFPWERADGGGGEELVTRLIERFGDDPRRPGLRDTPARVVRSWAELFAGYGMPPPTMTAFEETYDQMVVARDLQYVSTCEHHLLPFLGAAHICYLPNGRVLGFSKLARIVEYHARRLQIQERMTQEIAASIEEALHPHGVGVIVEGSHLCMIARGVRKPEATLVTSAVSGTFREQGPARAEMLALLGKGTR